jgi:hypothetical protein
VATVVLAAALAATAEFLLSTAAAVLAATLTPLPALTTVAVVAAAAVLAAAVLAAAPVLSAIATVRAAAILAFPIPISAVLPAAAFFEAGPALTPVAIAPEVLSGAIASLPSILITVSLCHVDLLAHVGAM